MSAAEALARVTASKWGRIEEWRKAGLHFFPSGKDIRITDRRGQLVFQVLYGDWGWALYPSQRDADPLTEECDVPDDLYRQLAKRLTISR